jgi:hypothetical protein
MQVRDQIHAPANLSPVPILKTQARARRCDENVNLSLSDGKILKRYFFYTKDKNKTEGQGRVNGLLLHTLKELSLKVCLKSIYVERTFVDFLRPSRQMFG